MLKAYRLLLEIMTPHERQRFWLLVAITFFLAILEVGSVISILPFLRLLAEPELIETVPILTRVYEWGGFQSYQSFLIAAGVAVFLVTVGGLMMKMLAIWVMTRFALMRIYSFGTRLMANYLHQPYTWFLSRHTSDLGNAILSEVDRVVGEAMVPATRLITDAFTVILLIAALCLMEPQIALGGALLLGGIYGGIFLLVRRKLTYLGARRLEKNRERFHVVQEATGGAKELKIMGLEASFIERFQHAAFQMARDLTRMNIIGHIPRQGIEAVAFGGMILLILVLLARGDGDVAALVPTLGLIAAIGLRLIPALQSLYQRMTMLRQSEATLLRLHADMTNLPPETAEERTERHTHAPMPMTGKMEMRSVEYAYPNTDKSALNDLSLTIRANTTNGIVGGTGAGKTTLVDIMLGLLTPEGGEILIDGTPLTAENRRAWQKTIGYVPQTIFLSDGTVAENIAFGRKADEIDVAAVERAAKVAELHEFITSELADGYQTSVGERGVRLSGGQRQRIGIARALYHDPSTLIFDEATSALDTLTEAAVMSAITRMAGQKTIIMIAHRLTTVQNCDAIFLLRHGKVAASGTFKELVAENEEFRRMATGIDADAV